MSIAPLSIYEENLQIVIDRIRRLMEGRQNAHGEGSIDNDGIATSTTITAPTCTADSNVSVTPLNANMAALQGSANGIYVVPAAGQFVVHHDATSNASTFKWSVHG